MCGCGNGAQIDGCWEKDYNGDGGHYEEAPDSLFELRFSTSNKYGYSHQRAVAQCCERGAVHRY